MIIAPRNSTTTSYNHFPPQKISAGCDPVGLTAQLAGAHQEVGRGRGQTT